MKWIPHNFKKSKISSLTLIPTFQFKPHSHLKPSLKTHPITLPINTHFPFLPLVLEKNPASHTLPLSRKYRPVSLSHRRKNPPPASLSLTPSHLSPVASSLPPFSLPPDSSAPLSLLISSFHRTRPPILSLSLSLSLRITVIPSASLFPILLHQTLQPPSPSASTTVAALPSPSLSQKHSTRLPLTFSLHQTSRRPLPLRLDLVAPATASLSLSPHSGNQTTRPPSQSLSLKKTPQTAPPSFSPSFKTQPRSSSLPLLISQQLRPLSPPKTHSAQSSPSPISSLPLNHTSTPSFLPHTPQPSPR